MHINLINLSTIGMCPMLQMSDIFKQAKCFNIQENAPWYFEYESDNESNDESDNESSYEDY